MDSFAEREEKGFIVAGVHSLLYNLSQIFSEGKQREEERAAGGLDEEGTQERRMTPKPLP